MNVSPPSINSRWVNGRCSGPANTELRFTKRSRVQRIMWNPQDLLITGAVESRSSRFLAPGEILWAARFPNHISREPIPELLHRGRCRDRVQELDPMPATTFPST